MGLGLATKNRNFLPSGVTREFARGVWGHAPPLNFFIGTLWCILGAFKIHIYYLRQKNNVGFFKEKTQYLIFIARCRVDLYHSIRQNMLIPWNIVNYFQTMETNLSITRNQDLLQ